MKRVIDQAIVLRRVNYGESDRVVTLLTKNNGKISVFAKSARKQKSRLSGGIELLSISEIGYIDGKSGLKALTSANLLKHFDGIVKDIEKTKQVFDALKQVEKLSDDGAGQEYYDPLETYMSSLGGDSFDKDLVEVWFRLQLLSIAGVLGNIKVRHMSPVRDKTMYSFNYDKQFFEGDLSGVFSKNDIKLLRLLGSHRTPIRLDKELNGRNNLLNFTKTLFAMNLSL